MLRKLVAIAIIGIGLLAFPLAAHAVIYSPTQAELLDVTYRDWVQEGAGVDTSNVDSVTPITDGIQIQFDTGYDTEPVGRETWRIAMEFDNTAGTWPIDLSSYDAFNIDLLSVSGPDTISAQIFVRSNNGGLSVFHGMNGGVALNTTYPVTLSIPVQDIIDDAGDPANVTSFGLEFFGGSEFGYEDFVVNATTSPQPPVLEDHVLFSWETPDDGGTPDVNEALENWGPGIPPTEPSVQSVSTYWSSEGTHSMKVDRTFNTSGFDWGNRMVLDANLNSPPPPVGDYNGNNVVDAADYTVWRDLLGQSVSLPNEDPAASTPGVVDAEDYDTWKANYGTESGGPDPEVMAQIGDILAEINDPNAYSIAFDVYVEDQFPADNPPWLQFYLAVAMHNGEEGGGDVWFQGPKFSVDQEDLANLGSEPITVTAEFLLSQMEADGIFMSDGVSPDTQYLNFYIGINAGWTASTTFTYYVDNFRVRRIVPEGAGSLAAVPEPSTMALVLMAGLAVVGVRRR